MSLLRIGLYAIAESGIFAVEFFVRLQLLIFYTDRLGLESYLASAAAGIALTWDAFIDPFVGALSDRLHARSGSRRPFLIVGALIIVPALAWLFAPLGRSTVLLFTQLLLANLLLNTGITLVTVPHAAISAELTKDAALRIRVFAARLVFANLGLMIGLIVPSLLPRQQNFALAATVLGGFCLLTVVICTVTLPRTRMNAQDNDNGGKNGFFADLRAALANRFFLYLFFTGFLAYIGVAINSSLARYYYDHYLKLSEQQFALVLMVFIIVWSLSVVFWVALADRFGKDIPAVLGIIALGVMTMFGYPLFQPGSLVGPLIAAVFGGIFTGCILLFDSYVADAADFDAQKSGVNRDGLYFGVWKFGVKASRGIAVVLAGVMLWVIGYRAGSSPDPAVEFRIALLFGPLVGSIFVLSGIVFWRIALSHKPKPT